MCGHLPTVSAPSQRSRKASRALVGFRSAFSKRTISSFGSVAVIYASWCAALANETSKDTGALEPSPRTLVVGAAHSASAVSA